LKRLVGLIIAVGTAYANWWIFYEVAVYFGSQDPTFMAWALLSSIIVHELGHLVMLEVNGIRTYLFFAVILGGAMPAPSLKPKLDKLCWNSKAGIYLAGVIGNCLAVLVAGLLSASGYLTEQQYLSVVNLNGLLILYNLVPWFIFDGGRFAKVLFDSVPEHLDGKYVRMLGIGYIMAAIAATFISGANFIIGGYIIFWGLHLQSRKDDPRGSHHALAMRPHQTRTWAMIYFLLLLIGLALIAATPHWMY
jgi:Zn-dependent protease